MIPTVEMQIEGMYCAACVATVERALYRTAGVSRAVVSLRKKKARVQGTAEPEELVRAVTATGYRAKVI